MCWRICAGPRLPLSTYGRSAPLVTKPAECSTFGDVAPRVVVDAWTALWHHIPPGTPARVDCRSCLATKMAWTPSVISYNYARALYVFVMLKWLFEVQLDVTPSLLFNSMGQTSVLGAPLCKAGRGGEFVLVPEL